jgi:hypothetical protein
MFGIGSQICIKMQTPTNLPAYVLRIRESAAVVDPYLHTARGRSNLASVISRCITMFRALWRLIVSPSDFKPPTQVSAPHADDGTALGSNFPMSGQSCAGWRAALF